MSYHTLLFGLCRVGCARMADKFEPQVFKIVAAAVLGLQHPLKLLVVQGCVSDSDGYLILWSFSCCCGGKTSMCCCGGNTSMCCCVLVPILLMLCNGCT
ncbi:hypothetical protein L1987_51459 [Smallanthus sonchifolius]|uniref:Uncharacterized protein n=1 Tax=Smallanthus sonchifolius TaxID=185202 RepID=A0ACB9ER15_9ASTR|nr:hypothetical protein L1987_51459 [Smallanthus sonchifolius]